MIPAPAITPKTIDVLGLKVFSDNLDAIPVYGNEDGGRVINTISPNSYGIALKDAEFRKALEKTDYLVLDGVYFAMASLLLKGKNIQRNQGPDVFYHFINRMNSTGGKVFFLGSGPGTLSKIEERIRQQYPRIEVMTYSPPFKDRFTDGDNEQMIEAINNFEPAIVFVGMTCPKQEKWAAEFKHDIKAGLIISIGNVFDWFAGTQKRIHPIWFKMRIGWLVRIFQRPEIFRRNIGNQMRFFYEVLLIFFKIKQNPDQ